MFLTNRSELQGTFMVGADALQFWNTVSLNCCSYSFLIEGIGLGEDGIGPVAKLVSDVRTVQEACNGGNPGFMYVNHVQLITSPLMNDQRGWAMEVLAEIRLQPGTEARPVYEFVTEAGRVYTSVRQSANEGLDSGE